MYVSENQSDWDVSLAANTFAYNTAEHETTKNSPFYLLYGRVAVTPTDRVLHSQSDTPLLQPEEVAAVREKSALNIARAQAKQAERYNERRRDIEYTTGDLVYVWRPTRKVGRSEKLLHKFHGPFAVVRRTGPVTYEIATQKRRRSTIENVHVSRLKLAHVRDYDSPLESGTDSHDVGGNATTPFGKPNPTDVLATARRSAISDSPESETQTPVSCPTELGSTPTSFPTVLQSGKLRPRRGMCTLDPGGKGKARTESTALTGVLSGAAAVRGRLGKPLPIVAEPLAAPSLPLSTSPLLRSTFRGPVPPFGPASPRTTGTTYTSPLPLPPPFVPAFESPSSKAVPPCQEDFPSNSDDEFVSRCVRRPGLRPNPKPRIMC